MLSLIFTMVKMSTLNKFIVSSLNEVKEMILKAALRIVFSTQKCTACLPEEKFLSVFEKSQMQLDFGGIAFYFFYLVPSSEETSFLTTFYGLYFSHRYTHLTNYRSRWTFYMPERQIHIGIIYSYSNLNNLVT